MQNAWHGGGQSVLSSSATRQRRNPPEAPYEDVALSLVKTRVHNDTLATFTFEASRPVQIRASQNMGSSRQLSIGLRTR